MPQGGQSQLKKIKDMFQESYTSMLKETNCETGKNFKVSLKQG